MRRLKSAVNGTSPFSLLLTLKGEGKQNMNWWIFLGKCSYMYMYIYIYIHVGTLYLDCT